MLVRHVLAQTVSAAVLLLAQGATVPVVPVSVRGAIVNFQGNRCLVEGATNLAEVFVAPVRSVVPGQTERASKSAQTAGTLVRAWLLVGVQVPLQHGSFEERFPAYIARDAIQHEVLSPVLVEVGLLVEPLAAL